MSSNQQLLLGASGGGGGSEIFCTPGTYCWVAPAGVTSVSIVSIGGGSGSGGALAYKNNITVVPGNSYQVTVGAGTKFNGGNGGYSYVTISGTQWASAEGASSTGPFSAGIYNADGGGKGGVIGSNEPGGGGGTGGYGTLTCGSDAIGGNGGFCYPGAGTAGANGSAGGGRRGSSVYGTCYAWYLRSAGGGGGGVCIYGKGATGAATSNASFLYCQSLPYFNGGGLGGRKGSCGANGGTGGTAYKLGLCCTPIIGKAGNGGRYGGGGGRHGDGGYPYVSCATNGVGCGADGVVRILWPGCARSFPSCNVGNP